MKNNFPGSTGPRDYIIKKVVLNYLTWCLFFFFLSFCSKYIRSRYNANTENYKILFRWLYWSLNYMARREFCLIFSPVHVSLLLQMLNSFGLCISEGVFIIQQLPYFYCIVIHICLLPDSCSWSHFLHTLYLITLNLTLRWPLCKVRSILLLKKRENGHTNLLHLSLKYIWSDLQHIRTAVA